MAGLLPDREEAFATAVSGLSGIISTANVMAVKCTADKIPDESEKIQLEVTGGFARAVRAAVFAGQAGLRFLTA